ncbi:MAG: rubredoxin-like domain-containing protein [Erysipelotrichaceae bacterium]
MKLWKCSVCGLVHEGESAPENCPKCGATADKFVLLDEEAATKIYRSDRSNDLHMRLITLAMEMDAICKEGIEDNLDPTCVVVFNNTKKRAWEIKQMAKAELIGHNSKGKL